MTIKRRLELLITLMGCLLVAMVLYEAAHHLKVRPPLVAAAQPDAPSPQSEPVQRHVPVRLQGHARQPAACFFVAGPWVQW